MPSIHDDETSLFREIQPVLDDIRQQLEERSLPDDYHARPAYQQNDHLVLIGRAKRPGTRAKRIDQMVVELNPGGIYMKMDHPLSEKRPS